MATEKDINELAKEKAEEIVYRQKIQELTTAVTEIVRTIPQSLQDIRLALDALEGQTDDTNESVGAYTARIEQSFERLSNDINNLGNKIRALEQTVNEENTMSIKINDAIADLSGKIVDKNNKDSLVVVLQGLFEETTKKLVSRDDKDSIVSIMEREFKNTQQKSHNEIQKNLNARTWITWAIVTLGSIITLVIKFLSFGGG